MIKAIISNSGYQWIWVGIVEIDGGWVHVKKAVNVRRYEGGIAALHVHPDRCTIDAAFGGVSFAIGAAIQIHDVDQKAWGAVLERYHS